MFNRYDLEADDQLFFSLFGIGDSFLVLSLIPEVARRIAPRKLCLLLKQHHRPLERLVGLPENVKLGFIDSAEVDEAFRVFSSHKLENQFEPGRMYFPHPSLVSGCSLDNLYAIEQFTQLDLYKQLLHLPLSASPRFYREADWPHSCRQHAATAKPVLLCPFANSYPPPPYPFWERLAQHLVRQGYTVSINGSDSTGNKAFPVIPGTRPLSLPLDEMFRMCSEFHWIIGALSGLMNVFTSCGSPNYKTFVIWDDGSGQFRFNPHVHTPSAFPYAYQTKYDGLLHNCDHVVASAADFEAACRRILDGLALLSSVGGPMERSRPYYLTSPPGEILDRASILKVKIDRLPGVRSLVARRELEYLSHVVRALGEDSASELELNEEFAELVRLNDEGWQANERIYQSFDAAGWGADDAVVRNEEAMLSSFRNMARAQALNRQRIEVKNRCSRIAGSTLVEVKSFAEPSRPGTNTEHQVANRAA